MHSSDRGAVHIVGAGVAGLAAAVQLAGTGRSIVVHEATAQPGGRCRTFYDHVTDMPIDNGTHLLLSGNHAALAYLARIGAASALEGPPDAEFQFVDLASRERWTVRFSDGLFPWWIFDATARVPQTRAPDYLSLARLLWVSGDRQLADIIDCRGPLYERLIAPLFLAALNHAPASGSGKLVGAIMRETLALGGKACRPLIAPGGIGAALIEPALGYLRDRGVPVVLRHVLYGLRFTDNRVCALDFGDETLALGEHDSVVLAVPAYAAGVLVPGLQTPSAFCGIVNAHFRCDPPAHQPRMVGVVNGTAEWIFALPGRISATVSDAGDLMDLPREQLAETIWRDVAAVTGSSAPLPRWQIVRERRATFAATPEENAKRPGPDTAWRNLFLAGDWTATGLPATIEGAVRSGNRAAERVARARGPRRVAA